MRVALAAVVLALAACGAAAQEGAPLALAAPLITSVTPGDTEAVIGFQAPADPSPSNPIREYIVSCEQPRQPEAGAVESE